MSTPLENLNVERFLSVYPVFAVLVAAFAAKLWRRKPDDAEDIALNRVARDYRSSIPALAAAVCMFIPAALFAHEADRHPTSFAVDASRVLEWPFWIALTGFFLCGLSIQLFGVPTRLIPPGMRSKSG